MVVGAYAAFTNVSAEEYGEGSFTKGFYITVPVDLFVFRPATGKAKFPWIPIARDGGRFYSDLFSYWI
ncbi:YjbH domain-containing protein [Pseudobowmanella zhangzhouensis]|uniref:YjbH domain-containing protein n=1 Tax=Pseudobowmanella zhangzhouensis TaxID=1537679 RepID=UPI00360D84A9